MSSNWSVLKLIKRLFAHLNYSQDQPPSLASLVTEQSCLTLDKINPGRGEVQRLKPPPRDLKFNYFYLEFESTIKALDLVNDSSERAIKLVPSGSNYEEKKEEKGQDMFLFNHVEDQRRTILQQMLLPAFFEIYNSFVQNVCTAHCSTKVKIFQSTFTHYLIQNTMS